MFSSVFLAGFGSVIWGLLAVVLVLVCLLLIVVILIQNPKGGGLTSAFGAGPGGDSLFGAKAQKDVTLWTGSLTFVFLGIVFVMVIFDPDKTGSAGDAGAGARPEEVGPAPTEETTTGGAGLPDDLQLPPLGDTIPPLPDGGVETPGTPETTTPPTPPAEGDTPPGGDTAATEDASTPVTPPPAGDTNAPGTDGGSTENE